MLVDFFQIVTFDTIPDYLLLIIANIPTAIRFSQCVKRYYEKRQAYPHLVNMGKYLSAIPGSLLNLNVIKSNRTW